MPGISSGSILGVKKVEWKRWLWIRLGDGSIFLGIEFYWWHQKFSHCVVIGQKIRWYGHILQCFTAPDFFVVFHRAMLSPRRPPFVPIHLKIPGNNFEMRAHWSGTSIWIDKLIMRPPNSFRYLQWTSEAVFKETSEVLRETSEVFKETSEVFRETSEVSTESKISRSPEVFRGLQKASEVSRLLKSS